MSFRWEPAAGSFLLPTLQADGLLPEFESKADAEAWLTQNFDALLEAGVEQVILHDGDARIYGPMSLEP